MSPDDYTEEQEGPKFASAAAGAWFSAVRKVPMSNAKHLDALLNEWPFDPQAPMVRLVKGVDGRDTIQIRVDLGILQLDTAGRPDGSRPEGFATYLELLCSRREADGGFLMDDDDCFEADREFAQFYHRRVAWLRLQRYQQAVADADHTLALMDMCRDHSLDEEWTMTHEQYRPFVLFHRTQAAALAALNESTAEEAIVQINQGLDAIRQVFEEHDAGDEYHEDEMVQRLEQLRESLREEYSVGPTLQERLAEAVASEQYELAARLRDELSKRS
jgi:hypothetical protein